VNCAIFCLSSVHGDPALTKRHGRGPEELNTSQITLTEQLGALSGLWPKGRQDAV